LVFLIAVGVDFARIYYYTLTVTNCARNGAMYGSYSPDRATDTSGIEATALADASNLDPAPTVATATGTDSEGHPVLRVSVSWTFNSITRIPPIPSNVPITRTVEMRIAPDLPAGS
jgi:hypothetical protein